MRQYKFDKPLVESGMQPKNIDVYWIDIDEATKSLLTIKTFSKELGKWSNILQKPGYFSVSISIEGEGVTVVSDKSTYKAGETVILTAFVEEEHELESLEVTWAGGDVDIVEIDDNHYSFTMPGGDVNAAGRGGKKQENVLSFISGDADFIIHRLTCEGEIVISTIKGGVAHTETYTDIDNDTVSVSNDANTLVTITGNVTSIAFYDWDEDPEEPINITDLNVKKCKSLTNLDIAWCQNLTSIDLSANKALQSLFCDFCAGLTSLDVSANTELTYLEFRGCRITSLDLSANTKLSRIYGEQSHLTSLDVSACTELLYLECDYTLITSLDLSANTALTSLTCGGCTGLTTIKYPATNSGVSGQVASAITAATADNGTVYTDSAAAYYSTIATAATTKGWTIEELPA